MTVRYDFALFLSAGLVIILYNHFVLNFPFLKSGMPFFIGIVTLGIFAALDLALERERTVISTARKHTALQAPPKELYPLTNKFFLIASIVTVLFATIILLVILRDISLLQQAGATGESILAMQRSITIEIYFVMGLLLLLTLNLIFSYSRNLRMLFDKQTGALEKVSNGNMDTFVPVTTRDEFGVIAGYTNSMIAALSDRLRLLEGIQVAQEVQQTLLPAAEPQYTGLDIAGTSVFSDETGGDFYDFLEGHCQDGPCVDIIVGDVTGHGVGAALLMASVRAYLRMQAETGVEPAAMLHAVNRLLAADTHGTGRFATLFLLQLQREGNGIGWASAGHDPAIIYDPATDRFRELKASGLPLGVLAEETYQTACCGLFEFGEVALLGTDGIWEARNKNNEMFGKNRVRLLLRKHHHEPAQAIIQHILRHISAFRAGMPQDDDITMVVVKRTEPNNT